MQQLLQSINAPEKTLDKLKSIGLNTIWDLVLHVPLRYEDLTKVYAIQDAAVGMQVQVEGEVASADLIQGKTRQLQVKISDSNQIITLVFFHFYPTYKTQFQIGKKIRAFGEIKRDFRGNKTIIHPKIRSVNETTGLPDSFTPIYSTTNGLTQNSLHKIIKPIINNCPIPELLSSEILTQYNLIKFADAINILHNLTAEQFKTNMHKTALKRLKFDELLVQQLILRNAYIHKHRGNSITLKPRATYTKALLDSLSFSLTKAQTKVLAEIYMDIAKPTQMNRLLQGDVGSGKTIIATLAMLVAVENGYQACIVAPTEILAEQHFIKTRNLLEAFGINVVWLSGSLKTKEKQEVYPQIKDNKAQIIIGTHAVLQKKVEFYNLALVVIDEQHRFGVEQRLSLQSKGINPHQLMMSATPIPRTLAMSYYADLDLSIIDELPPGRTPIKTLLINNKRRHEVIEFIRKGATTQQVYWVCPLIEESNTLELENAVNTFNELSEILSPLKIGLVHGRLKTTEKTEIMHKFQQNQIQILVATTVIEVGVDVPNASIMVIEHSERMGLSQLHQLRGRVGRGHVESQCILLYQNPLGEVAKARLKAIFENTDGFKIAYEDLLIRGPGEILGSRQSGLPLLRFANLEEDLDLLNDAKTVAIDLLKNNPNLAQTYTKLWFSGKEHFITA
ncbi:MAG: ATP-dependent helicase RecG [Burkholderiales bacterium]|jgi:ATP-dependent DNA helicase RecG|nr:ATP-dependent helicase RecG [Burkholderiales bacterium]